MTALKMSEQELDRIVRGILDDRESIIRHNPIGTPEETLLWMLLGVLISYLNLDPTETPCFPGLPTADTYREAARFVLNGRTVGNFDIQPYLDRLTAPVC